MPKFMDVHHSMQGITAEQLLEARRANQAVEGAEGVRFEEAWADPESGEVFCLSEAPSADAGRRVHERTGHQTDEVHPVPLHV
jgi:hypothetical protein